VPKPTTNAARRSISRRTFLGELGFASGGLVSLAACTHSARLGTSVVDNSVAEWLARTPVFVAHRGGDADWPECSADAYRRAAAWNARAALEAPVWSTSDGAWVLSDTASTATVFGTDYDIPTTPWPVLARLRSTVGHQPIGRLVSDVLEPYASRRILFVDNKSDTDPAPLLALLARYGGPRRIVMKSYWAATETPVAARRAGYLTWGYYYARNMGAFAATQARYDLLGLDYTAPSSYFATMRATGKSIIAHTIRDRQAAAEAFGKGAAGLMVSGVIAVIPHLG
jgi:glycerophosphoryl diester phosphodiesterase